MIIYDIEDIYNIKNNNNIKVEKSIIDIITNLSNNIENIPIQSNYTIENKYQNKKPITSYKNKYDDLWRNKNIITNKQSPSPSPSQSLFKITKIDKKQGIELYIDEIRFNLNKITLKNFDTIESFLVDKLNLIVNNYNGNIENNDINLLGREIFNIMSTNMVYSELYTKLYMKLMLNITFMEKVLKNNFDNFYNVFNNIEFINPDEDYDKYCEINKINQKRRSLTLFYIHLMNNNVIEKIKIIDIIEKLYEKINGSLNNNICEELSEIIFIIIKNGNKCLKMNPKWNNIYSKIVSYSKMKSNIKIGISNKFIFKFMDIVELLK